MVGISAFGAYVPLTRLQREAMAEATAWFNEALTPLGKGERSVASWDEDAITMAVEAARDCLNGADRKAIGRIFVASTTFPFADRQNAGVVKEALNLEDAVGALDIAGSQRASTSALLVALETAKENQRSICVASERRFAKPGSEAEFTNGDAAAAFLVDTSDVAAEFLGSHSTTADFVDHFRAADQSHDYEWEGRWIRDEGYKKILPDAIKVSLSKMDLAPADVNHFVLALPVRGIDKVIATAVGIAPAAICPSLSESLGYAGSAHALVMLAHVLETAKPGALILVAAFGQGCDILAFRATDRIAHARGGLGVSGWLARRRPDRNYLKHLYFAGEVHLDGGMRSEIDHKTPFSMLYRDRKTILGLVGGKCRVTGTVQYPKTRISVAQNARMIDTQDDYPLAEMRARIVACTADRLAFTPNPPGWYGLIEFEEGGRLTADFTDIGGEGAAVGQSVRMMFRLKHHDQRGFKHYFWKAVPDYRPAN